MAKTRMSDSSRSTSSSAAPPRGRASRKSASHLPAGGTCLPPRRPIERRQRCSGDRKRTPPRPQGRRGRIVDWRERRSGRPSVASWRGSRGRRRAASGLRPPTTHGRAPESSRPGWSPSWPRCSASEPGGRRRSPGKRCSRRSASHSPRRRRRVSFRQRKGSAADWLRPARRSRSASSGRGNPRRKRAAPGGGLPGTNEDSPDRTFLRRR